MVIVKYILFTAVLVLCFGCSNSYLGRYVRWNVPKANNFTKMPYKVVKHSDHPFSFQTSNANIFPASGKIKDDFEGILESTGTNAFIIIRNDTILYEKYYNTYNDSTLGRSFSITKSFLSALIGIAIDKKYININDHISQYVPELAAANKDITIRSLLNMSSGLTSSWSFLPWADMPKTFYSPNVRSLTLNNLKKTYQSGNRFQYNNYNALLLGIILEKSTHMSVTAFFEKYLWSQIGTSSNSIFSIDSKKYRFEKVDAGLAATVLDFAKFGRLYLNNGMWNQKRVIPASWVKLSSSIDTLSIHSKFYYSDELKKKGISYRNGWWQMYDNFNHCEAFWASGYLGQIIWIQPQKKIIVVRLGKRSGGLNWEKTVSNLVKDL